MARKLTEKEFISELASRWGTSYNNAKNKYYIMIEFLCDELLMYGFVDLPTFGKFKTELQQGKYIYTPVAHKDDKPEKIWIDAYERIKFKASKTLKDYINHDKATKAETMRQRREIKKQQIANVEKEHQIEVAQNITAAMEIVQQKKKMRNKSKNSIKNIDQIDGYWDELKE